jgi:hypothetical protein
MSDISTSLPAATPRDLQPQQQIHRGPGSDPLRYLPDAAADRLRQLQLRVNDLRNLIPSFAQLNDATNDKIAAAQEVSRLTGRSQNFGFNLPPSDPRVVRAQAHLDEVTAEAARLGALTETRTRLFQAASGTLSNVMQWLRGGRPANCTLQAVEIEPPRLAKGEDIVGAIENRRKRVAELKADLAKISAAPFPSSYTKRRLREQIEQLAARGRPDVTMVVKHDANVGFPMIRLQSQVIGADQSALGFAQTPDMLALVCFLQKEQLLAALSTLVDAESDDAAALSVEARQISESETQASLLDCERQEAGLVWSAQSQGQQIEHRADISPLALLGLRLVTAPRANELPETSPGYSWPWRR